MASRPPSSAPAEMKADVAVTNSNKAIMRARLCGFHSVVLDRIFGAGRAQNNYGGSKA
jgi:hypothetical protein